MTKPANSSKPANNSGSDWSAHDAGYRQIGIAAVAAAVRCQKMARPEDERTAGRPHSSWTDPS